MPWNGNGRKPGGLETQFGLTWSREIPSEMTTSKSDFRRRLFLGLMEHCYTFCPRNRDIVRYHYNWRGHLRWWCEDHFYAFLSRFGLVRRHGNTAEGDAWLCFILDNLPAFEALHCWLADDASRERLIDALLMRILGERHVRLSTPDLTGDHGLENVRKCLLRKNSILIPNYNHPLDLYQIAGKEIPIQLHANGFTVRNTFLFEQYVYRQDKVAIQAEPGDVVIDGGGCWGDTALFFADRVGKNGKVHSFEFDPENIAIFHKNLELNPLLKERVVIVPFGLWNVPGQKLGSMGGGVAASLSGTTSNNNAVETLTIDHYAREKGIRADFIKLDIEGAELKALQGAEKILREHRPKLAVCLYHSMQDFIRIPEYLDSLGLGYTFYLGHVPPNHEETVLFAIISS
jgi:FkbM family methyltransferase